MITINQCIHINQIVKDPENTGRTGLALILSNLISTAKDTRLSVMNLQNRSSMISILDIILNKFVKSSLACATPKAPHQKQSP